MYICYETIPFDTEFCAPANCPRNGDVDCKVVSADCRVAERWDHWATIVVRLLLRIRVRSCKCECSFTKVVESRQTVWMEHDLLIEEGRVTAAVCRCVINDGWVHCHATARCRFVLKKHHWCHPCRPCHHYHPCRHPHPCHESACGHAREEGWADQHEGYDAEERDGFWHDEESGGPEDEDCSGHKETGHKETKHKQAKPQEPKHVEHHGQARKGGCC